jgi:hypothetical protein
MRRTHLVAIALAIALWIPTNAFAATALPEAAPTPPPTATVTYTYRTFFAPEPIGGTPVGDLNEDFGTLQLTFNANGIISGTYRPDFGSPIPVTGGRESQRLWLDFDTTGRVRVMGEFTRRGFVASSGVNPTGTIWRLFAIHQHG